MTAENHPPTDRPTTVQPPAAATPSATPRPRPNAHHPVMPTRAEVQAAVDWLAHCRAHEQRDGVAAEHADVLLRAMADAPEAWHCGCGCGDWHQRCDAFAGVEVPR